MAEPKKTLDQHFTAIVNELLKVFVMKSHVQTDQNFLHETKQRDVHACGRCTDLRLHQHEL